MASEFSTDPGMTRGYPGPRLRSVVFAPRWVGGGVKSLYAVCEWLDELGQSAIMPFGDSPLLAAWFSHRCRIFDFSYEQLLVVLERYVE